MPRKPIDPLQRFIELRASLARERDMLRKRLVEIERALGNANAALPSSASSAAPAVRPAPAAKKTGTPQKSGGAPKAKMGMRETIAKVLSKGPLGIRDIVNGMESSGYYFKSSNPTNSVGAFLYGPEGKKTFVRSKDGLFSIK